MTYQSDPFGMLLVGCTFDLNYRYGFNGKENDDDVAGNNIALDFGARIYDTRIGRWLSIDRDFANFPAYNPYCFSFDSPILFFDPDGNSPIEAGAELQVGLGFFAYLHTGLKKPSPNKNSTIYDIDLYNRMSNWNTIITASGFATGVIPKNLFDIFQGFAQDYGIKDLSDMVNALLDASFSKSYQLDNFEFGPDFNKNRDDNLPNKYIHRVVTNMGTGFEAVVRYKEEYHLTYDYDENGKPKNVYKTLYATYTYSNIVENTNYGVEGTEFQDYKYIQTETKTIWNYDGSTSTSSKTYGLNKRKNSKECDPNCD